MKKLKQATAEQVEEVLDRRPLDTSIAFLVRDLGRAVGKALGKLIEPHGIGVSGWLLLRCISANEGLSQRELSQHLGVMEPSSLELLLKLEEQGLVSRSRSEIDRRRVEIRLTRKGRTLFEQLWEHAETVNNEIMQGFDDPAEADRLRELLAKVRSRFP